jgi:dienelactone hydrolase
MRNIPTAIAGILLAAATAAAQTAPVAVTLKAPDGITLKASYYSPGRPGPAVMLLHQCNASRSSWTSLATAAAARGYHVLAMDYRGFGESGGDQTDDPQAQGQIVATKWPGDVDAAFAWLVTQPGVDKDRIGAAGASCGVNQSVQLARRHPEVKTVILLSGGLRPDARLHLQMSPWMPILAAASLDDGGTVEGMRWNLGWSRNPKNKFIEYKAAGHGTEMFAVEKGLQPAMLDWFDAHLRHASIKPQATTTKYAPTPIETFWNTLITQPGGAPKAKALYEAAKRDGKAAGLWPEQEMNLYGYQLLQEGSNADALIVMQLNADAYPTSANVFDSLSDAYLANGNQAEALRYAEKALAMLPTDTRSAPAFRDAIRQSAEQKVRDLKKK